ncbi:MAG TPA: hypothetical protein VFO85_19145, partial [Vicinamibacteria bacterium]|nr:hypothetical protein [Vicinamibacteria bacterium]
MRNPRTTFLALGLLALALGTACGSAATGITLSIDPDPVPAAAQGDGSYVAAWDAVVADLTGVGGTVEAADVSISGAASVSSLRENPA